MKAPKVFISHSAADSDWVRSFADALKERGLEVSDFHPSESSPEALESGLRDSDVVVALLDQDSPARPNLFFEIGAAIGMGKRVVAVTPGSMDRGALPVKARAYLVRDTPEHTAEELSNTLQAA